jgi:hypothetical protein
MHMAARARCKKYTFDDRFRSPGQRDSFSRGSGRHCLSSFKRRLRRQSRMETETRRALDLESAVRQGAGLYPRCCADQKERKRKRADEEPMWVQLR